MSIPSVQIDTILDLIATVTESEAFLPSVQAFVTTLASRLACDRVSFGTVKPSGVRVDAISGNASFHQKADLVQAIGEAMEEAIDQGCTIVWPSTEPVVSHAHQLLGERSSAGTSCSVLLSCHDKGTSVLTLERSASLPFDSNVVQWLETLGAVIGPILEWRRRDDQSWLAKTRAALRGCVTKAVGPRHLTFKLVSLAAVCLMLVVCLATGNFRVTAKALVEGELMQATIAPFDGYLDRAYVRAGDRVHPGQLLATLQDRDLILDRLKWESQAQEFLKEYRQALAEMEAAKGEIVAAKLEQAQAELALAREKLSRTRLIAPFAGVVVTGDLSQKLGSPVEEGQVLFEIAPLDHYRLILEVDERDIAWIRVGQEGTLRLSALPHDTFSYRITKITSVSAAKDGRNVFRVEGTLEGIPPPVRPSMEGVAKTQIDERRLVWIWTHDLVDWLRVKLWAWLP